MSVPISFTPRHTQPFTLEEAMQLEVETLVAEINRLRNSIAHLRESQAELNDFLQSEEGQSDPSERSGEGEISKAVKENEEVISSQNERIALITIALSNKLGSETRLEHYGLKLENGQRQPQHQHQSAGETLTSTDREALSTGTTRTTPAGGNAPVSAAGVGVGVSHAGVSVNVDGLDAVRALSRSHQPLSNPQSQHAEQDAQGEAQIEGDADGEGDGEGGLHL
ncbi:hypothetical protein IAU59_002251 [Kwoniella sp. CBS 9459]